MREKKYGFFLFLTLFMFIVLGAVNPLTVRAEFAADISGATAWGTTTVTVYQTGGSSVIGQIEAKEPFQILGEYGSEMLEIEYQGMTGCVRKDNILVNFPDVEPNINYNLTNASGSVFTSTTQSGTTNLKLDIFGTQLYYNGDASVYYDSSAYSATASERAGKVWNAKLGRYEFVVPILYTAAEKFSAAERLAEADGYRLKIYDAYRTNVATKLMNASFNSLYSQSGGSLYLAGYNTGFFVAASLSSHNIGCAIDVTLEMDGQEAQMPSKMHVLSGDAVLMDASSGALTSAQLYGQSYEYYEANFADTMTDEAREMCWYMIQAGLTGLGSEWWHFQDQEGYQANKGYYGNLSTWYPCRLYAGGDTGAAPAEVTTRGEAVYQLWAAAGFPDAAGEIAFTDVTEYDYYYNAVRWAVSAGILSGSSTSEFSPDDAITRAGFLNMLYRYCGSPSEISLTEPAFEDVSANAWYYDALQWAAAQGITVEASGSFSPAGVLYQEQMHIYLTRANASGIALNGNYL